MMELPPEIHDRIVLYVEDPTFDDSQYIGRQCQLYDTAGRERLSVLRLINKGFCRSASLRLFRIMHVKYPSSEMSNHWAPKRLFELSQSQYCTAVREIEVATERYKSDRPAKLQLFTEDLAALLPASLCNFKSLSVLKLSFPNTPRSMCTELVGNIFRYVPLSSLNELHLALPLTCDFATLLKGETINSSTSSRFSIKSIMKQLRYLSVSVCDGSGNGGQRYFQTPATPAQTAFPNQSYSDQLFEFVQLAEKLSSLQVTSTHILNMDVLDTTYLQNLRYLELTSVKISHTTLLSMIQQSHEKMNSIWFCEVQLKSGTWKEVLVQLCCFPHLEAFRMDSCGYSTDGRSSKWALRLLPPIDELTDIETLYFADFFALGNLQRQIVANRHANGLPELDHYTMKYEYRHAKKPSLEDYLAQLTLGD
ncbi:hypothetical protein GLAREA_12366 [Glarea lozoyensis ATCC 20868]|uniref:Uncharacterized protein n=1 Tax=Glarea lozoyensis (strain ATCC 20868 / MF5171) TaxID=1116229 RepID=S3D180_GLAL2|nr:uncharacterized protein GLAREA_12366 [Glarea lozoyensis ATCC 20868]EPE31610.1 hypothetical protein GLAREA_12366 [Glarea lozoyensis ATCC 20868]